jgi:hypothetical protein
MEKIKKLGEKHLAKKDKFFFRSIFHVSHDPIMGDEKKSKKSRRELMHTITTMIGLLAMKTIELKDLR